jgi:hypothetical protein
MLFAFLWNSVHMLSHSFADPFWVELTRVCVLPPLLGFVTIFPSVAGPGSGIGSGQARPLMSVPAKKNGFGFLVIICRGAQQKKRNACSDSQVLSVKIQADCILAPGIIVWIWIPHHFFCPVLASMGQIVRTCLRILIRNFLADFERDVGIFWFGARRRCCGAGAAVGLESGRKRQFLFPYFAKTLAFRCKKNMI